MPQILSEQQRQLRDTATSFLNSHAPVAALRRLRDSRDALGYDADVWARMAELGWPGITIAEEYGGLGFGFLGLATLLEQCGRTLCASPLFASCVLGASAIMLGGDTRQKQEILPRVASGKLCLALALEESHHHDPLGIALRAAESSGGFVLNGEKQFVLDGHSADKLIVAARSHGEAGQAAGISLFLVDGNATGLSRARSLMMDSRNAARIALRNVEVSADALIGPQGGGHAVLEQVLDRGRAALAAEMLGSAQETFTRTIDYLKQREQFGVRIGTLQALQHRAAHLFSELELARSCVYDACSAADDNPALLPLSASLAKAKVNDCFELISNEAVQMHGGIGTTDALDIGLFLKRARVTMQTLGTAAYHRNRYATLRGF